MGKTAKDYIAMCKKYLGYNEYDGSHKKIVDIFNSSKVKTFPVTYSDPWCATYISAMAINLNMTDKIPITASCDEMYEKGVNKGIAIAKSKWVPKIGDIVLYDWDSDGALDHVGAVCETNKKYPVVIEGNSSDSVKYIDLNSNVSRFNSIVHILRPKYENSSPSNEPVKHTWEEYLKVVEQVINGNYGNGDVRKEKLEKEGYTYKKVQSIIDILLK